MTVNLKIRPNVQALLAAKARAIGVPLENFLEDVLEREASRALDPRETPRPMAGPEKAQAFRRWAKSFPADLPVLSIEAVSRESIYRAD
jgi:hypothetical protein